MLSHAVVSWSCLWQSLRGFSIGHSCKRAECNDVVLRGLTLCRVVLVLESSRDVYG